MVEMGSKVGKSFNLADASKESPLDGEGEGSGGVVEMSAAEAGLDRQYSSGDDSGKDRALLKTKAHFGERALEDHDHNLVNTPRAGVA